MTRSPVIRNGSVSVQGVWLLALGAQASGLDVPQLLGRYQLAEALGADVDARVPAGAVLDLWAALPELTQKPHFGLWLAELACAAPATSLGAKLVHSAPTLGAGLERLVTYERVLHGVKATFVTLSGDALRIEHRPPIGIGPGAAPAIEFAFAWILGTASLTTGTRLFARRVEFTHEPPPNLAPYESAFGVSPRFGGSENALELDRSVVTLPQRTADPLLEKLVERHAESLSEELPSDLGQAPRVRALLTSSLARGDTKPTTLVGAAQILGLSPRTLQRRLADEGLSFAALLDEARRDLSLRLLADPRTSVAEIAFALGFGDQPAFHRAFVRWMGSTPGEHRRRLRVAEEANPK